MKVGKIMTTDVGFCGLKDDLSKVVETMRHKDCGVVPVVDAENQLVGVITDRDVCLAVGNKKLSAVKAGEITGNDAVTVCAPDDKIKSALRKMRKYQLKRLPVVGQSGEIVGILSVTDVLREVKKDKSLKKQTYKTLRGIFEPRPILLKEITASELI
ncbi:MAG TPA: CBS domain-containing protein [Pyrinomonadaceae bacterium]|nr:CBS domain-containing protein [Pyrinomonadaceae bacterium]